MLLCQILKGVSHLDSRSRGMRVVGGCVLLLVSSGGVRAETIHITPKNGVPSAWELISVEPDRVVVRKGGARFEFSKENIEKVSNPKATRILKTANEILAQVDRHDPEAFPRLQSQLEEIFPQLEQAAKYFTWVIPELTQTRDRVEKTIRDIDKTLELTGTFAEDLTAIEKMAAGRSPVASNWEEVVQNTLTRAKEIPFEDIRERVVSDIEAFRRSIRLSLVRRTEEAERRIRDRGESILEKLERGEIDPERWALILRDLRRQVTEEVPDPDLRLELEEYLDEIEARSADKLVLAREKIEQRNLRNALGELEGLVLDTTHTEEFTVRAQEIAAQISSLSDSVTKEELQETLSMMQSDHEEALAQLARMRASPEPVSSVSEEESSGGSRGLASWLSDWRILGSAGGGGLAFFGFLLWLSRRKGGSKTGAPAVQDIPDVPVVSPEAGEQDLLGMLSAGSEPPKTADPAPAETSLESAPSEEDPFGLGISGEKGRSEGSSESEEMPIVSPGEGGERSEEENPFGFLEEPSPSEETPVSKSPGPEATRGPEHETGEGEEDPFGFSTVFSEEEDGEDPLDFLLADTSESESDTSGAEDLFSAPAGPDGPEEIPAPTEEDPFGLAAPGSDAAEPETENAPSPESVETAVPSDPQPPEANPDDPFGLLLDDPSTEPNDQGIEEKQEPSPSPPPSEDTKEEDLFGFGDYFEESDPDRTE